MHILQLRRQISGIRLLLMLIVACTVYKAGASVRTDLKGVSMDSLHSYYKMHSDDPYKVRYVLRYFPMIRQDNGIQQCPGWVRDIVSNALHMQDDAAQYEAVNIIAYCNLQGYTQNLVQLYHQAPRYSDFSREVREAIIEIFAEGRNREKSHLIDFFNECPANAAAMPEFLVLTRALAQLPRYTYLGKSIDTAKVNALRRKVSASMDSLDPEQWRDKRRYEHYTAVLSMLEKIMNTIEKGGNHE